MAASHSDIVLTRHDISLFGIGSLLLCGLLVGLFSTIALSRALLAVSVPSALCVGYTLFYRPPETGRR